MWEGRRPGFLRHQKNAWPGYSAYVAVHKGDPAHRLGLSPCDGLAVWEGRRPAVGSFAGVGQRRPRANPRPPLAAAGPSPDLAVKAAATSAAAG